MRCAVVLPGSGSSVDFITRAFAGPLAAAGYHLNVVPPAEGPEAVAESLAALSREVARCGATLVGGVSLGAHLAARWAASAAAPAGLTGLLLVLPAWTGPPGDVAMASALAADQVEAAGTDAALAQAARHAEPWVAEELAAAWPLYADRLAGTLRATAASHGPTCAELTRIAVPTGVVAFADDPLHPHPVATQWATLIPRAHLATLPLSAPAADRAVLGRTALEALAAR